MHDDVTRMGNVIRKAREAQGLTQAQLAEKIATSLRTVAAIEKDKRNPTYVVLRNLILDLDIPADHIFRPEEQAYTPEQEQLMRELFHRGPKEQELIVSTLRTLLSGLAALEK